MNKNLKPLYRYKRAEQLPSKELIQQRIGELSTILCRCPAMEISKLTCELARDKPSDPESDCLAIASWDKEVSWILNNGPLLVANSKAAYAEYESLCEMLETEGSKNQGVLV